MKKHILILSLFLVLRTFASGIEIKKLTCDLQINPLGIHHSNPFFGWVLTSKIQADKQTAYQILIASSSETLAKDEGDVWNSGKVTSEKSQYNLYRGVPLKNGQRYYWKVKVWDAAGNASTWSEITFIYKGLCYEVQHFIRTTSRKYHLWCEAIFAGYCIFKQCRISIRI
jgi:alpha-L-rhamnosidase